jgi:predicted lipoprotein with Yx(FWY)xxD motif
MRIVSLAFVATVVMAACGGAASAPSPSPTAKPTATPEPTVAVAENATLGKILIAATNKMTLYTYTKDTADTSNCYDACATAWPPFTITGAPVAAAGMGGKLATAARKDGSMQLTHNSKPLYFYNKDLKSGDTLGQNVGTVWFVVSNP